MGQVRRRKFLLASGALLAAPLASIAQPAQPVRRIGFLSPYLPPPPGTAWLFRESLRRAGYEEGKNLVIEARFAEGNVKRLPVLAEELVRSKVEVIVAVVNSASDAARRASQTIPIVMFANMFPVERGLAASLARPGGNVTGTVWWAQPQETATKMYQILKEAAPYAKRAAEIRDPTDPQDHLYDRQKMTRMIATMGMTNTYIELRRLDGLKAALDQIKENKIDVLYVTGGGGPVGSSFREIAAFAIERKLVSISDSPTYIGAGGLLTYGPDGAELYDRTVSYVDRILRGAKPADLPIEQASKYVMAFNTKTARAIGFTPPPSFMLRVDKVVE